MIAFDQPFPAGLSGLARLNQRVSIYYSHADQVLILSMAVNLGAKRLGQDGPHNRADPVAFPTSPISDGGLLGLPRLRLQYPLVASVLPEITKRPVDHSSRNARPCRSVKS